MPIPALFVARAFTSQAHQPPLSNQSRLDGGSRDHASCHIFWGGGGIFLILLLAAFLRFHALAQDLRFQADEALFATFARNAALNGQWLFPGALDKPPLTLYAMALSMSFAARGSTTTLLDFDARQGEFAARVPNTFASLLLVAVTYALAKRLHHINLNIHPLSPLTGNGGRGDALFAALLMACSPLLLVFSASAFTDMLMLLGMVGALWMASAQRPLWAGVWLAFAFASKQQALYYAPLVLGALYVARTQHTVSPRHHLYALLRFLLPLVVVTALLLLWDAARAQDTGLFALASANNSPYGLAPLREIPARIGTWLSYGGLLLGLPLPTSLLMLLALLAFVLRPSRVDALLWAYIAVYSAAHWLIRFNIYDRYLLLLLPPCVLLAARAITCLVGARRALLVQNGKWLLVTALCLVLLLGALPASQGNVISGRADDSILQLADFLNSQTLGAIVYDRWIGWELGYYLGQWTDKRKVYFPTPDMLAAGALAQEDPAPRYFVTPANRFYQPWLDALRAAGFHITLVYDTSPYLVFRLIPSWAETDA